MAVALHGSLPTPASLWPATTDTTGAAHILSIFVQAAQEAMRKPNVHILIAHSIDCAHINRVLYS